MTQPQPTPEQLFVGDRELARLARSHDWSQTPLGALETWPDSLKTAAQILLTELAQAQQSEKMQIETEPQQPGNLSSITVEPAEAAAQLRELEIKHHTLFESLDEGFCVCELLFDENGEPTDYRFLEVNAAFERLTGLEQVVGKTARELVPNQDAPWVELFGSVVRARKSVRFEAQESALNRWLNVNAFCIGEPQRHQFAALFTNISETKRIEAERQKVEQERERFLAAGSDLQVIMSSHGYFHWVSPAFERILGWTPAEMTSHPWTDFLHPDDIAASIAESVSVLAGAETFAFENRYRHKDGSYRWLLWRAQSHSDEQVLYATAVDITARKQAEVAIAQREAQFRQLADAMPQQVWITDAGGNTQYVNQQWSTYTGLTLEQTQDIHYATQVIHPDDFEMTGELWRTALAAGTPYQAEFRLKQGAAQTYRWFLSRAIAIRDEQGQIVQWFGTSTDIEELRRAQAEREQLLQQEQVAREAAQNANRIKDEFLAVLSHELRSPLNPILGWTQLLRSGKLDPARQMDALDTIERNAKLQAQLIEDLLDVSRIMQGKLILAATSASLASIIAAAAETVGLAAAAKNIQITLDLDPDVAPVSGDAARLQQVVWNLLTNAVKFTDKGGQVTVQLRQVAAEGSLGKAMAQIRVIDTGKGIRPQFLPHVFESFWQEDGSTTRKFGGLGLGLAIVRQIVESHGGTVSVESDGEHQGAAFSVQLPALQQATPVRSEQDQLQFASETRLDNVQILLVEDDTDAREFQSFLLEQHGATVTAVASGVEALQVLEQFIPNVIVSDIGMEEMDGYGLMQQIRSRPPTQGGTVPAIALTAYAAEIDREKALQAGFQTHLTKPLEPERFVSEIITLLEPKQV